MNLLDTDYTYTFPAIRGIQAKREYFITMCPLKLIPKLFFNDLQDVPPEYRAQRVLNKTRIPEITKYIIDNPDDYVFSSLTASIDGEFQFVPFSDENVFHDLGKLVISMDAKFLINDGQHRRAAIEEALFQNPDLANETISIVLFSDRGLKRSQQMFADLNKHAINTTKSIGILFDHRDPIRNLTLDIIDQIPLLRDFTDKESNSLSKYSSKIFILSNLYEVNCRLILNNKKSKLTEEDQRFVLSFWSYLCDSIKEWNDVKNKLLSARELRSTYIHSHGVVLEALGIVGSYFYKNKQKDMKKYLAKLNNINWSRQNMVDWRDRVIRSDGRIAKSNTFVIRTSNLIKQKIGLELTKEEQKIELEFLHQYKTQNQ